MLGLELRREFKGRRLKGTAIELTDKNKTGATQVPTSDFLKITYPTADVLKTIEAIGPNQGRPVALNGERGQGKSHLMAMICHAFADRNQTGYLKKISQSGRWIDGNGDTGHWVPPIDLALNTRHGRHQFVLGRPKWKSTGGYPTLTHGGLSILEVAVPFIEISHEER